jgi:acetyl esterase
MTSLAESARIFVAARVLDGIIAAGSRVSRLSANADLERDRVEVLRDLRYVEGTTTREHLLDVWRPLSPSADSHPRRHRGPPWPIVLYVHGGGFSILSKESHWMMALAFARRGYLVFNVNYRLAPRHPYPAAVQDVCLAFDWVVKNAARFGGDTNRVVLAGESAGANLVTSLSIALAYERPESFAKIAWHTGVVPQAVLPACGIFQVSDHARFRRSKPHLPWYVQRRLYEIEAGYLGRGPWPCSLDLADPLVFFERGAVPSRPLPPFFLSVGTKDPVLPDTRRLGHALRALGVEVEERYYPGEGHAFHARTRPAATTCWTDTFAFLDNYVPIESGVSSQRHVS